MATATKSNWMAFRDYGLVLVTRDQGEPVRAELLELMQLHDFVEVDLGGVEAYTPSFMDEVLGKCLQQVGKDIFRTKIHLHTTEPEVRKLVNLVLTNRAARERTQPST